MLATSQYKASKEWTLEVHKTSSLGCGKATKGSSSMRMKHRRGPIMERMHLKTHRQAATRSQTRLSRRNVDKSWNRRCHSFTATLLILNSKTHRRSVSNIAGGYSKYRSVDSVFGIPQKRSWKPLHCGNTVVCQTLGISVPTERQGVIIPRFNTPQSALAESIFVCLAWTQPIGDDEAAAAHPPTRKLIDEESHSLSLYPQDTTSHDATDSKLNKS